MARYCNVTGSGSLVNVILTETFVNGRLAVTIAPMVNTQKLPTTRCNCTSELEALRMILKSVARSKCLDIGTSTKYFPLSSFDITPKFWGTKWCRCRQ